jgi:hypothetical protein
VNVVAYGGGVNSTAMLIGMRRRGIPVDLILFADTGGERPSVYEFVNGAMSGWLRENGLPPITPVYYRARDGTRLALERECLESKTLPSLAYGFKRCSLKHKRGPQEKFCNNDSACRAVWASGEKAVKFIGYDAGEERRRDHAAIYDMLDKKYSYAYPLIDWGWTRDDCARVIREAGLPAPEKSACFFCPATTKREILELRARFPDLFNRALALETNAAENLIKVQGLGRRWSWAAFVRDFDAQIPVCGAFDEIETPCECYD